MNRTISWKDGSLGRVIGPMLGATLLLATTPGPAQPKGKWLNSMPNMSCKIEKTSVPSGFELVGKLWSDGPTAGNYRFIVDKVGANGRSKVSQSGVFSIEKNETLVVGTITLNQSRGDRYLARLVISDSTGEMCSATL